MLIEFSIYIVYDCVNSLCLIYLQGYSSYVILSLLCHYFVLENKAIVSLYRNSALLYV